MNRYIQYFRLLPGDEIVLPKSLLNLIHHHTVFLGYDHNGQSWMIENKIGYGVILTSADMFFHDNPKVTSINRFSGTNGERKKIVEKALSLLGKPYHLINFNCEHFSNEIRNGEAKSHQVAKFGVGIAIAFLIGIIFLPKNNY